MVAIFTGLGAGFERGSGAVLGGQGLLGSAAQGRAGVGVSVNAASGNVLIARQDEFLVGLGPDVSLGQVFNSVGSPNENSDRWRFTSDRRIFGFTGTENTAGSTIRRLSADGADITYTWDAAKSAYITTEGGGTYDAIRKSGSFWEWTDGDSLVVERYAAYGQTLGTNSFRLIEQRDTDGNKLNFSYNSVSGLEHQLLRVTSQNHGGAGPSGSPEQSYVDYVWNATFTNRVDKLITGYTVYNSDATVTDNVNQTLTRTYYTYDTNGRLKTVETDLSPNDNSKGTDTYIITYGYDTSDRVTSIVETHGSATGTELSRLDIVYNGSGQVTSLTQAVSSGVTRAVALTYVSSSQTNITGPDGQVTELIYDTSGNLLRITAPAAYSGASQQVVQFVYESDGDLQKTVDARGEETLFTYDAWGNVLTSTDRTGAVVTRTYSSDDANTSTRNDERRLLTETWTASDETGSAVSRTRRYVYDSEAHLRYVISPEGRVTQYGYSTAGLLLSVIAYPEHAYASGTTAPSEATVNAWVSAIPDKSSIIQTINTYDARGGLLTSINYGVASTSGGASGTEGYTYTATVYNQVGQMVSRNMHSENAETFAYDGLGRLVASTNIHGASTSIQFNDASSTTVITYAATGLTTTSTYNKAGDLISYVESGSYVTAGTASTLYDHYGRARVVTDASGRVSYNHYDKAGRLVASVNGAGEMTEYRYDANNRLIATVRYATLVSSATLTTLGNATNSAEMAALRPAVHADDQWSWLVYDDEGRVLRAIEGDGAVTAYAYDAAGQLVSTIAYYAKLGTTALTGFRDNSSASGWPSSTNTVPALTAASDSVARSFYDKDGRLVAALDGEGYVSKSTYDKAGYLIETRSYANITASAQRASGSLTDLINSIALLDTTKDRFTRYVRDGRGLLRYEIDSYNQVIEHQYNLAGKLTTTHVYAYPIGATDYTYDDVETKLATATTANAALVPLTRSTHRILDAAGRTAYQLDGEMGVTVYAYDSAGRVIRTTQYAEKWPNSWLPTEIGSITGWESGQTANAANRVTRVWYSARGETVFTVDAEGYVTKASYDAAGRLVGTEARTNAVSVANTATIADVNTAALAAGATRTSTTVYDAAGRVETVSTSGSTVMAGNGTVSRSLYYANGLLKGVRVADGTAEAVENWLIYDKAGRVIESIAAAGTSEAVSSLSSYDGLGNMVTSTDPRGVVTNYSYDRLGRMVSQTDALGKITAFEYNAFGETTRVTDALGRVTLSAYDRLGRVTSMTDALLGVTAFEYTRFGDLWKQTDARGNASFSWYDRLGRATLSRDAEGYVTQSSYTAFSEVASVTRRHAVHTGTPVVTTPQAVTATSGEDATTTFKYDRRGLLTQSADALWVSTAPLAHTERFTYNAYGERLTSINMLDATTSYTYDNRGLLVSETRATPTRNAAGVQIAATVTTTYGYDLRGNRKQLVEASGLTEQRTTLFAYDKLDRLVKTTHQAVNVIGDDLVTVTSATPEEHIVYDTAGNVIETRDAAGARTLHYYDALGRRTASIDALGGYSAWTYDDVGNVKTEKRYASPVGLPTNPGGSAPAPVNPSDVRTTRMDYDALNRMSHRHVDAVTYGSLSGTTFTTATTTITVQMAYDANGNLVQTTDALGNVSTSWYDKLGRKTAEIDAEGYLTSWVLDGDGNVVTERRYTSKWAGAVVLTAPPAVGTAVGDRVTGFTYDLLGRRLTETRQGVAWHALNTTGGLTASTTSDATITYSYNALGQVLTKSIATGPESEADLFTYTYDTAGRLSSESRASFVDAAGVTVTPTTSYNYNGLGDLVSSVQAGSASAAARTTSYVYGTGGRLASMTDAGGFTRSYAYDVVGRVKKESYARTNSAGGSVTDAIATRYDALGRTVYQAVAQQAGATFTVLDQSQTQYNHYGEVWKQGVNRAADGTTWLYQTENLYDNAGRLWATNAGDGVWKIFVHDKAGNQTAAITSAGTNLYTNVQQGHATGRVNALAAAIVAGSSGEQVNASYTQYDKRNMGVASHEEGRRLSATGALEAITASRTYNAFGEVVSETDGFGNTTTHSYNLMGRLIRSASPTVSITLENGSAIWVRPTIDHYYDRSGRLIATRDANGTYATNGSSTAGGIKETRFDTTLNANVETGNLTTRRLLAGTGHQGSEALVTHEYHADGGIAQIKYDIHGDARTVIDEVGRTTDQLYDAMGRVTQITRPGADVASRLIEYYAYDGVGQRLSHYTSHYGSSVKATTDYDAMGRVTSSRAFGETLATTTGYVWNAAIATTGVGTFGGWVETTTYVNTMTSVAVSDMFGRATAKTDMGGRATSYTYDVAGRMLTSVSSGITTTFSWFNTGQQATNSGPFGVATYAYDKAGRRTAETLVNGSVTVKNATSTYDVLGRTTAITETGNSTTTPAANVAYTYDANGNIRRVQQTFRALNDDGTALTTASSLDHWFGFDAMNRLVIDKGVLAAGQIYRGGGTSIMYDEAGQRVSATMSASVSRTVWRRSEYGQNATYWDQRDPEYMPNVTWTQMSVSVNGQRQESYAYDASGRLASITQAQSTVIVDGTNLVTAGALGTGVVRSTFAYDLLGRQTGQTDYEANGTTVAYNRTATFNTKGQLTVDDSVTRRERTGSPGQFDTYQTTTRNDYDADGDIDTGAGATYALGSVVWTHAHLRKNNNNGDIPDTMTRYNLAWYDGAVNSSIQHDRSFGLDSEYNASTNAFTLTSFSSEWTTTNGLNGLGQLISADINDGRPRDVTFTNDELGQIVRRDELDQSSATTGDPHEVWYRFGNRQWGMTGNNGSSAALDNATSIADRQRAAPAGASAFASGANGGTGVADFTQSYDPINSYSQGSTGGGYTVRQGDTLQGIALAVWGDANLWYKIAEANGLSASAALIDGQNLILPAGINNSSYNASSLRPYDPQDAIGDTSPTSPKPPKKNKCAVVGQLISTIVAVAASYFLGPVIGNVVSQGFNNLIGTQNGFSFKSLAIATVSAGVTGGINGSGLFGQVANGAFEAGALGIKSALVDGVVRTVAANALTQGLSVATGLQSRFSFASVAAAGVVAGISGAVSRGLEGKLKPGTKAFEASRNTFNTPGRFGNELVSGLAGGIAGAATRSAIEGSSFGDNLLATIPDVVASSIGRAAARGLDGDDDGVLGRREKVVESPGASPRQARRSIGEQILIALRDIGNAPVDLIGEVIGGALRETVTEPIQRAQKRADLRGVEHTASPPHIPTPNMFVFDEKLDRFREFELSNIFPKSNLAANLPSPESKDAVRDDVNLFELVSRKENIDHRLRSLHNEANQFSEEFTPLDGTREWTVEEFLRWRASGSDVYVHDFKRQWVSGYRDAIIAAAERFDIPPELLAGVAYNEVGGDPLPLDDAAYIARPQGSGRGDRDRTSFGNVSIQVRRAAESLGYGDSADLSDFQRRSLLDSLRVPASNIFIAAKHLADIRNIFYRQMSSSNYTYDQIVGVGVRYNAGPLPSEQWVRRNDSYGRVIAERIPELRQTIGLGM